MSATELLAWGAVAHLICDWLLQNEWMAVNKTNLRHPAGYVHAGIHGVGLALVFGWVAVPLAISHLLIDTRVPVVWWSRLIGQTQPEAAFASDNDWAPEHGAPVPVLTIGDEVRIWVDQVWHIGAIAIAALVVAA